MIAFLWAVAINKLQGTELINSIAVALTVIYSAFSLLGVAIWYGNAWNFSRIVGFLMGLSALSVVIFYIVFTLTPSNYTYTGCTAILFFTNFWPACYVINQKALHKDVPLKELFLEIAHKLATN